jgi:DNA polymerase I-like protein with 3'-5' exonuclease and polymerase domains
VGNVIVLDVETTTSNKGDPFDQTNKLCYVGIDDDCYSIEYDSEPFMDNLNTIQSRVNEATTIVGFNIKFDLHWLTRYGIGFRKKRVWDCQVAHFIITNQRFPYPSLNKVCQYYGLPNKIDVVKDVYWDNDIDTPDIPREILEEYLQKDVELTKMVYLKQVEYLADKPQLRRLISLHNQDLMVLQEMEYNGLLYKEEQAYELALQVGKNLEYIDGTLLETSNCTELNLNSVDHLSAFLYGGSIKLQRRVPCGVFKTGPRAGEPKEKWEGYTVEFPQLVKPLKGTALAKEGLYSTNEATLRTLRGSKKAKEVIELLQKRSTLEKRLGTYYIGLTKLITKLNWNRNEIHGQLNQCVAATGRLSSSKPNLQNFDGVIKVLFPSRFQGGG